MDADDDQAVGQQRDSQRVWSGAPGHTTIYVYPPTHTELVHRLDEIVELLHQLQRQATARADATTEQGNAIMALVQVEQTDLDNLATALNDLSTTLTADDAGLAAEIADLTAKVNAGGTLTAADLTGLQTAQANLAAGVAAASALLPAAPPPPPPAPAV